MYSLIQNKNKKSGGHIGAKPKQKAKFRPLQSLSKAFYTSRRKQEKSSSDDEVEDYSSDESDDAYYNPDGAEDDWDMCDPDERQRNTFVALVTKDKYERGILNYEEMCHMLKQVGMKPPPFNIKEQGERSARQKYAKGIITYDECCHILRLHGVTDFPKEMVDDKVEDNEDEDSNDDEEEKVMVKKEEDEDNDIEAGSILSGAPIGQISPSRFSRKKMKPQVPATVMPVTPLTPPLEISKPKQKINFDEMMHTSIADDTSSDSDYGDVVEDGLGALDDWGDVAENVADDDENGDGDLLKSVSIMSSTKLGNTLSSIKKRREKSLEFERNRESTGDDSISSGMMNEWLSNQSDDVRSSRCCCCSFFFLHRRECSLTRITLYNLIASGT